MTQVGRVGGAPFVKGFPDDIRKVEGGLRNEPLRPLAWFGVLRVLTSWRIIFGGAIHVLPPYFRVAFRSWK